MELDLSSLRKAVDSLERTLRVAQDQTLAAGLDNDAKDAIRAGVIQNFEFTYELCWKFIRRWIKENADVEEAEHPRTRKELFRLAARFGLIRQPLSWFSYGDARNLTSHTYDEHKAESVYEAAVGFAEDARYLLDRLEEHND
ncbi:MAG: nucleotidyltransferase substrate binding protein [Sedimentisphaerales bacterium]|jgi:nucleotidyltransferase substrate binding protein (TIGR01987 family)